jgi:dTMP kinase
MYRKRPFFITFEGIEGSGKTYLSKKLFKKLKKEKIPVVFTREPGGSKSAEIIRKIILSGSKNKFNKYTDTLLYLAARSEHVQNYLIPNLLKKKVIICDRFVDSTLAYQGYGKKVNLNLVNFVHKQILNNINPHLTFVLKVDIKKSLQRINKRKIVNRYDKFSSSFYSKVQNGFIKIAKRNKKKYIILDNTNDSSVIEKIIFNKVKEKLFK